MSFASIGGILLIIASWFTYRGNIFMSIILYLAADLCWFGIALSAGDYFGGVLVSIGMLLGIGVFIKMNKGIFVKNLRKNT